MTKVKMPAIDMAASFATKTTSVHGIARRVRNYAV
jgi:hypothetical protein